MSNLADTCLSTVSLGKFGSFNSNLIIGRPYYLTFEIQEKAADKSYSELRVVPASEIHAEDILDAEASADETRDDDVTGEDEVVEADGIVKMKNNQHIIDDPSRQGLSLEEIEELKKSSVGSGQEIIDKIMSAHANLDEKTAFSLAKYIVRKRKKYLKRFTVLPLDVSMVTNWMVNEKEPARSMELREETLGLIGCWSNAHCTSITGNLDDIVNEPQGRWLAVDDTGGLIVASLAERMGILHPVEKETETEEKAVNSGEALSQNGQTRDEQTLTDDKDDKQDADSGPSSAQPAVGTQKPRLPRPDETHQSSTSNVITLIHPATQPNISFLSYFGYDPSSSSNSILSASHAHPLHTHLHTVSILQLLHPEHDTAYSTPPPSVTADELASWKTSKRSTYHRKRRRYDRTRRVVDATRAGGFDGLVIASATEPLGLLDVTVPLLRGGAQVVVYSPHVEPLVELVDAYSSARKGAFMNSLSATDEQGDNSVEAAKAVLANKEDFPVDPRLLLAPNLQTARAVAWQVLPGRSHPMMTSKGGAEGFVFTATRVIPVEGRVEARGRYIKRRKVDGDGAGVSKDSSRNHDRSVEDKMDVDGGGAS